MSPALEAQLKICQWTPGRRVNEAQVNIWIREAIRTYGCHVFPEAVRILREFGGLNLVLPGHSPLFVNSVFENSQLDEPGDWLLWEWTINKVLFPIAYDSYLTVFAVATDGAIFSNGINGPFREGDSFEQMLDNYFTNKKAVEMVEVYGDHMKQAEAEAMQIYKAINS